MFKNVSNCFEDLPDSFFFLKTHFLVYFKNKTKLIRGTLLTIFISDLVIF